MSAALRIFWKDVTELSRGKGFLSLIFVAPMCLLLLVGNVNVKEPVARVAVYATDDENTCKLRTILAQLSNVIVIPGPADRSDLIGRAQANVDVVAMRENNVWRFYTPQTDPVSIQHTRALVSELALRANLMKTEVRCQRTVQGGTMDGELPAWSFVGGELFLAGAGPAMYFPPISRADRSGVPGFIALVGVFLPFLLAAGALSRERELGTLGMLVIAARSNWLILALGKLLLPVTAGVVNVLMLLVISRAVYSFGIKPGLLSSMMLVTLAITSSALLGLAISVLVHALHQVYVVSAIYLLCLILLTGIAYPLSLSSDAVQFVSVGLPLTFLRPAFYDWMTKGIFGGPDALPYFGLTCHFAFAALICWASLNYFKRTL